MPEGKTSTPSLFKKSEAVRDRIAAYSPKILRRSAIRNDHKDIAHFINGHSGTLLEIGSFRGASAAYFSQFFDHVITIDLIDGQAGDWDRKKFWCDLGIDNITEILVKDDKEKSTVVKYLDFDFAFIDGAHDEGVILDFKLVKKCGNVLFHDYGSDRNKVTGFVNTLDNVEVSGNVAFWTV